MLESPLASAPQFDSDNIVVAAEAYYNVGLNAFPIPFGCKEPYGNPSFLTATRLDLSVFPSLFSGSNIAIMMGRSSGNLFVLDCDSIEDYRNVGKALSTCGISPWIRTSSRGGQFWFRSQDGEVMNSKIGKIDILGGNHRYVVAPPSTHPDGSILTWELHDGDSPPLIQLKDIEFLDLALRIKTRETFSKVTSVVWQKVLINKDMTGYASNSEAELAACLSLLGQNYTPADILDLFQRYRPPHFAKQGIYNFEKYILGRAVHQFSRRKNDRKPSALNAANNFIDWANNRRWPGKTGNSDRLVFLALCQRMKRDQQSIFRASIREVSELANLNKDTVYKAIHRLISAELIRRHGSDEVAEAALFSIIMPTCQMINNMDEVRTLICTGGAATPSVRTSSCTHDIWHRDGLGKTALFYFDLLTRHPGLTTVQITDLKNHHPKTIENALTRLELHGLVTRNTDTWYPVPAPREQMDLIAEKLGSLGRARQRTLRHQIERQIRASDKMAQQKQAYLARKKLY